VFYALRARGAAVTRDLFVSSIRIIKRCITFIEIDSMRIDGKKCHTTYRDLLTRDACSAASFSNGAWSEYVPPRVVAAWWVAEYRRSSDRRGPPCSVAVGNPATNGRTADHSRCHPKETAPVSAKSRSATHPSPVPSYTAKMGGNPTLCAMDVC
jgi:hypothetical protein